MDAQDRPGIRQPDPPLTARASDKWHLDEVVITIAGKRHWLWRAVDLDGLVPEMLVQSRRDKLAAKRLLRKLAPRFQHLADDWLVGWNHILIRAQRAKGA